MVDGVAGAWLMLISFVVGIILGALLMFVGFNRNRKRQQTMQKELEKSQNDLESYRQELVSHFAHSAEILKNMAEDYHQLHQHMVHSSNKLLPQSSNNKLSSHVKSDDSSFLVNSEHSDKKTLIGKQSDENTIPDKHRQANK